MAATAVLAERIQFADMAAIVAGLLGPRAALFPVDSTEGSDATSWPGPAHGFGCAQPFGLSDEPADRTGPEAAETRV